MKKIAILLSIIFTLILSSGLVSCKKTGQERTEYNIECSLNENILHGQEKVRFFNHSELALKEIKFNLFGNAFREGAKYFAISSQYMKRAYPNGLNYGDMKIENVKINEKLIEYKTGGEDNNILIVPLINELFPEEIVEIDIEFTLNLANVIARTGYNDDTINLANFYPIACALDENGFYECNYYSIGDPFYSDAANYNVILSCDSQFIVASSGKEIKIETQGNKTKHFFMLECARDFAFVLSKKFKKITDNSLGTEINYYYYDDAEPNKSIEYAIKAIKLFNEKFGKYPYQTLAVAQTQFVQGGMEFPALAMISDDISGQPYGEVIVHETAHQWWQSAIGNNEIEHGFLDEGLAEYSVILFYENYSEYGFSRQSLIKSSEDTYKIFCSVYDKIFHKVNTVMTRSLKDFSSEYEYVNIAYIKPCIMYDTIRQTIGDERFFNSLKRYYNDYKFKNATPDDLMGAFEKTGADTNGIFESFFLGKAII